MIEHELGFGDQRVSRRVQGDGMHDAQHGGTPEHCCGSRQHLGVVLASADQSSHPLVGAAQR